MQCFNHQQVAAVGICKHCSRGLCVTCAADLEYGLACRGVHEEQVTSAHALATKVARLHAINRSNKYLAPAFVFVMGVLFAIWGLMTERGVASFTLWLGIAFLLYGAFLLRAVRKAYARMDG